MSKAANGYATAPSRVQFQNNLEEPAAFNQHVADFLHAVDVGRWPVWDPRAIANAILGE